MNDQFFQYDAAKRHFVPWQGGDSGVLPATLETLDLQHEMLAFRKQNRTRYLVRLVSDRYELAMVSDLDSVGRFHTSALGSQDLNGPLVQINALMGFVASAITATILSLGLTRETKSQTRLAFGNLLWIPNDPITRHYQSA